MGRTTAVVLLIAVVALSACSGGDDGVVVVRATSPVAPAPSATATATVTPTVAPSPAPPPLSAPLETSTPVVLTSAPTGEALAAPTHSGEVGVPLSANDVAQAVELDGRGYSFWVVDDRAPICSGSAVPGRPHWSANLGGSDFGPVFVLWVYRDVDALQQDWEVVPGEAPRARFEGCDLTHGFVYWNENLVMAFEVWLSLGEDVPLDGHGESPADHPAVRAFLALAP